MMQVPTESGVTVLPETLHTPGVSELRVTTSPEVAAAATVYGGPPTVMLGGAVMKVMLWLTLAAAETLLLLLSRLTGSRPALCDEPPQPKIPTTKSATPNRNAANANPQGGRASRSAQHVRARDTRRLQSGGTLARFGPAALETLS